VQPFQNRLVRMFVPGKVLKEALEHAVAGDHADAHVSGLELWYDPRQREGHRVGKVRLATGRGIDDGHTYTVAVSDFLATGGSGYAMFRGLPAEDVGLGDLDALIRYLAVLRSPVETPGDERIHRAGR
jgi:2',3'-cyclic-nucleotide 2'-phosphodiesterase (5'-nucleotidase family)